GCQADSWNVARPPAAPASATRPAPLGMVIVPRSSHVPVWFPEKAATIAGGGAPNDERPPPDVRPAPSPVPAAPRAKRHGAVPQAHTLRSETADRSAPTAVRVQAGLAQSAG